MGNGGMGNGKIENGKIKKKINDCWKREKVMYIKRILWSIKNIFIIWCIYDL